MRIALTISALLAASTPALERLEPPQGCILGFTLGSARSVSGLNSDLGFTPAGYVEFFDFSNSSTDFERMRAFFTDVAAVHGVATLTLEAWEGLNTITAVECDRLASLCREAESHGIAGIFLRFGHEMNGNWYPWGQRPILFKTKYRLLAEIIHAQTARTAMIWAPNYGVGYPFGALVPKPGSDDFNLLDTNHDGQVSDRDDMYEPYYPGNDVVDWVGMTIYHWGLDFPWLENEIPPANSFTNSLVGKYHGSIPNFYARYCLDSSRHKPFAVTETAAFYNTQKTGAPELQIKRAWWTQIFSATTEFPLLKCVNWFDELKRESIAQNNLIDWRVTGTTQIRNAFVSDLRAAGLGTIFLTANDLAGLGPYYIEAKSLPTILPVSGSINVSLDVKAEAACDLVIDLLDENYQWQGGTRMQIMTPGGPITTSFRLAQPLTDTTSYRWSIFLTPSGKDWTAALAWYRGPNPSDDPDADGASNKEESIAGTSPRNATDVLKLNVTHEPDQTMIAWNSKLGRTYQLLTSVDLKTWQAIGPAIPGTGARLSISQPPDDRNARLTSYRLKVTYP